MKKWYQQKSFLITILLWFVGPIILIVVDGIAPFAAAPAIFAVMLIAGIGTAVWFVCDIVKAKKAAKAERNAAELRAAYAKTAPAAQEPAHVAAAKTEAAAPVKPKAPEPQAAAQAASKPRPVFETHNVAGVNYRVDNLMQLASKNSEYHMSKTELIESGMDGQYIYRYDFLSQPVELIDEPDNPYDPKAIKVVVAGQHIGYIKRGSTGRVRNLRKSGRIIKIYAEIGGGSYKYLRYNEDGSDYDVDDDDVDENDFDVDDDDEMTEYELEKGTRNYFASLEFCLRPEGE